MNRRRCVNITVNSALFVLLICWAYALCRVFVGDIFSIPSDSMSPTLQPGDRVWVNKMICGARVLVDNDSLTQVKPKIRRLRGLRSFQRNDIIVFNNPIHNNRISFTFNDVFVKRIIAEPGDSVCIRDGFFRNNCFDGTLGFISSQDMLNKLSEDDIDEGVRYTLPYDWTDYPWTIRKFGPVYVPRSGDVICLNQEAVCFYKKIIEYETGELLSFNSEGKVLVGDVVSEYYCFEGNYYFVAGDALLNSYDSRYWGFLPEEYIVGVVSHIVFSRNLDTKRIGIKRFSKVL